MARSPLAASVFHRLILKLETTSPLSAEDERGILALPTNIQKVGAGIGLVQPGDHPQSVSILVEGFAYSFRRLPDGGRQIMSFHVSGDALDLEAFYGSTMDRSVATLTRSVVATIPHTALGELARTRPTVGDALVRDILVDAAIFRAWLTGVGRRSPYRRIAHLMCELFCKMKSVGLADTHGCDFPLTQIELADSLGLSTIHTHRALMSLRRDGLIVLHRQFLHIPDWTALKSAADFDPAYLRLAAPEAA